MGTTGREDKVPRQTWTSRPLTHGHAVHVALEDVEGVPQVPFRYVEDDVSMVGGIRWRDGS